MPQRRRTREETERLRRDARDWREHAGFSVQQIAAQMNLPASTIWRWLNDYDRRSRSEGTTSNGSRLGRKFGIEVEFIGSRVAVEAALRIAGFNVKQASYSGRSNTAWLVKPDGSVANGGELVSPPLAGEEGIEQVRRALAVVIEAGATVSRSCGLHVHHDASDLDLAAMKRIVRLYVERQHVIDAMVAPSRRAGRNGYCRPWTGEDLIRLTRAQSLQEVAYAADRYRTLNVAAYAKHGTIEIRQHQGTVNARKVIAWIRFGQRLIDAAIDGNVVRDSSVEEMLTDLRIDDDTRAFMVGRAAALATRERPRVRVLAA